MARTFVHPGEMNTRIAIYNNVEVKNDAAETVIQELLVAECWAKVDYGNSNESDADGRVLSLVDLSVYVRYDRGLFENADNYFIKIGGVKYQVVGPPRPIQVNRWLELKCKRRG